MNQGTSSTHNTNKMFFLCFLFFSLSILAPNIWYLLYLLLCASTTSILLREKLDSKKEKEEEDEKNGSLTWCLMTEICAPNLSFFFLSIPFSNLDPIPLHCSCHCNFFILLLLLLFSCVFSFFTANALKQCAFSFVSFKFSYLIFSQWCQMLGGSGVAI